MKKYILVCFVLISGINLVGQVSGSTSMILRYHKVVEFVFDEKSRNYVATDSIEYSGAISIDPFKIFIKSYNTELDKTLTIVETLKEDGTNRDMFLCEIKGEKFAVAITPDKKYLTQIGINEKLIYELMTSSGKSEQVEIINLEKASTSNDLYLASSIEKKPIFGSAKSFEEGEPLLKAYLKAEINNYKNLKSGKSYFSIVINEKGKVEDVNLLLGKDDEFNKIAQKIVSNMPDWIPGQQKGKFVKSLYNLEVKKD